MSYFLEKGVISDFIFQYFLHAINPFFHLILCNLYPHVLDY